MPVTRVPAPKIGNRIKGPTGSKVKLIAWVIHTAEGARTAESVIDYLAGRGISVPYGADGTKILRMTPDGYLGYGHAAGLTGKASGVELCGFASWSRSTWLKGAPREMVRQAGQLAAYELGKHYPITREMLSYRIIGHAQDSRFGGTSDHWDPGPGFPYDVCIDDALEWAGMEDDLAILSEQEQKDLKEFLGNLLGSMHSDPAKKAQPKNAAKRIAKVVKKAEGS